MTLIKLKVKTQNNRYPIIIGDNILSKFGNFLKENSIEFNQCLLVIDNKVPREIIKHFLKIRRCLPSPEAFLSFRPASF